MNNQELFLYWVKERLQIYYSKESNESKPWTKDTILQQYKFCNVHREHDTVTKWIKYNWRDKYPDSPYMPFAMVVARTINWPETLASLEFPYGNIYRWMGDARERMKVRRENKQKVWTGAYLVSTNGHQMDKIDYIIDKVWLPFYNGLRYPKHEEPLQSYWRYLREFDGLGSFMAAQVVCDLKYTKALKNAPDWWRWAALGPGSTRGINRYLGKDIKTPLSQEKGLEVINQAQGSIQYNLGLNLHAQDVQNCFCEYDKYVRVLNNEGRPRSTYPGV